MVAKGKGGVVTGGRGWQEGGMRVWLENSNIGDSLQWQCSLSSCVNVDILVALLYGISVYEFLQLRVQL